MANLYLRYLLERKCSVDQILVVTFTEAATQELRDRIRARIQDLSQVFEEGGSGDPVLQHLYQQSTDIEGDKLRLKLAERQIDLSEIHTIHGFCQQLLSRYALEINIPFNQSLMEDLKPLLKQACEDFWRQEVLSLPKDLLIEVRSHWSEPDSLLNSIRPLISRRPEVCHPAFQDTGIDAWKHSHKLMLAWYCELRERTLTHIGEVESLVRESSLKNVKSKLKWLANIRAWCESAVLDFNFPKASKRNNLFEVFTPGILQQETKSGGQAPEHAYFSFLEVHLGVQPVSSREVFLVQSYQIIATQLQELKSTQDVAGFDDLILTVANALRGSDGSLNESGSIEGYRRQENTFSASDSCSRALLGSLNR